MEKISSWFYQGLYRSYHQGSSFGHFVGRRVTPVAWFIMGLFGLSMLMGGNADGQSVIILLGALLVGIMVVSFVWAFFRRAHVSVRRFLPATGSVDEELKYRVELTNRGKRNLPDIRVLEIDDDPRPTAWEFLHLKEPGEDQRNFFDRIFIFYRWKWLMGRGGKWQSSGMSKALTLKSGETTQVRMTLIPKRRGMMNVSDLRVVLPDPFGLFQRCRRTLGKADEILVVPKRYHLPPIELGGQSELKVGGETASTVRGEGGEFLGLREYRPGDPMRKIHWKSWARTGTPVVKEHEENRFARYGLILDTSLHESSPEIFEECVSVAASFVSTMDKSRCLLDLMFVRDQPQVFTAGRGVARASQLMEVLARVEASDAGGYDNLEKLIKRYSADLTAAVVVFSGWDEERENFVGRLLAIGLHVKVYAVVSPEQKIESRVFVHPLRWGRVEQDLLASM